MSARAVATGSINLGQGFPDTDGPVKIAQVAADAILAGRGNQYPPGPGIGELRQAIADHAARFYGLRYDPAEEILVTAGATEAVAAAILASRPGAGGQPIKSPGVIRSRGRPGSGRCPSPWG